MEELHPEKPLFLQSFKVHCPTQLSFLQVCFYVLKRILVSSDAWIRKLFPELLVADFQQHGDAVKELIWEASEPLLKAGVDVILDFSLWQV